MKASLLPLAGALAQNGMFLYVPRNVVITQPLHSLMWGPGTGYGTVSHILVYLEEGCVRNLRA